MKKGMNTNHPKKDSDIKVEPIKSLDDIKKIRSYLADKPRDLALFTVGINTNLRASDLLKLTAGQVRNVKAGEDFEIIEVKTKKKRRITLNKSCVCAIKKLLASAPFNDADFLFRSQRSKVLTVPSVNRLVKGWCRHFNLKGNFGSHTLRKTWGYHQRVTFGSGLPELVDCFNHSSQKQTLAYLCIQPQEIHDIYMNEI